jgi:hypothetical protein
MQEYALFVCAGVVIAWSQFLRKDARALLALIVLIPALFLTGGRGPIVLTLLACCVMWAIQSPKRSVWFPRLVTALAFGIIGVGWSLNNADSSGFGKGAEGILNHQKQGLLDPSNSTASKHADLVSGGIMAGIKQPIGYGLGITTSAAGKFGGEGMSSEMDISNLFISLGIVGGVLYALVMYRVFKDCARLWRITRDPHYQVFIGLFVTLFGQWLNGNLYALCFFVWYLIGYIDKQYSALLDYEAKHGTSHSNGHGGQPAPGRLATAPVMAMNSGVMIDPRQSQSLGGRKRRVKFRR